MICRKCYIHPKIITAYLDGALQLEIQDSIKQPLPDEFDNLRPEEAAVLAFLRARVGHGVSDSDSPSDQPGASAAHERTGDEDIVE